MTPPAEAPTAPRIGSLCSGYGGLDLAVAAHHGASVAWHAEVDRHANRVLEARWPGLPNLGDLTRTDWAVVEPVDILTAGYPCQPFSTAGNRRGKNDPRHLWPHIADAISILRPRRVVLENVAGHVGLGFADVLGDLTRMGFDSRWGIVRASDAGAPHRRARLFVVADAHGQLLHRTRPQRPPGWGEPSDGGGGAAADPAGTRSCHAIETGHRRTDPPLGAPPYQPALDRWAAILGRPAPDPLQHRGDARPRLAPAFVEWLMGLPAGWVTEVAGVPHSQQLKLLGNGVVPAQAALALDALDGLADG